MQKRSYQLRLHITNGIHREYRVRPLSAAELPAPFVAGFVLTRVAGREAPAHACDLKIAPELCETRTVYHVRLAADGAVNCDCPQWVKTDKGLRCGADIAGGLHCKHAAALVAAGLLPVALVQLLHARTALLDLAEARAAELVEALAVAGARVAELAADAELRKPPRRRRKVG